MQCRGLNPSEKKHVMENPLLHSVNYMGKQSSANIMDSPLRLA